MFDQGARQHMLASPEHSAMPPTQSRRTPALRQPGSKNIGQRKHAHSPAKGLYDIGRGVRPCPQPPARRGFVSLCELVVHFPGPIWRWHWDSQIPTPSHQPSLAAPRSYHWTFYSRFLHSVGKLQKIPHPTTPYSVTLSVGLPCPTYTWTCGEPRVEPSPTNSPTTNQPPKANVWPPCMQDGAEARADSIIGIA